MNYKITKYIKNKVLVLKNKDIKNTEITFRREWVDVDKYAIFIDVISDKVGAVVSLPDYPPVSNLPDSVIKTFRSLGITDSLISDLKDIFIQFNDKIPFKHIEDKKVKKTPRIE